MGLLRSALAATSGSGTSVRGLHDRLRKSNSMSLEIAPTCRWAGPNP